VLHGLMDRLGISGAGKGPQRVADEPRAGDPQAVHQAM